MGQIDVEQHLSDLGEIDGSHLYRLLPGPFGGLVDMHMSQVFVHLGALFPPESSTDIVPVIQRKTRFNPDPQIGANHPGFA